MFFPDKAGQDPIGVRAGAREKDVQRAQRMQETKLAQHSPPTVCELFSERILDQIGKLSKVTARPEGAYAACFLARSQTNHRNRFSQQTNLL
jgi:hypothetical protein